MLFGSSILLTAVVGSVIASSTDEEWRQHQLEYLDLAMGRASSETVRAALESSGLEIKQDMLTGFGEEQRVDRCRSCHAAIDDPSFADGEQPLRTHPEISHHPFSEFGCTICHEGDGRALDSFHAHGEDQHCPHPRRSGPMIEASCARCHPAPYLEETPHLRRGRELFDAHACGGCHTVRGVSRGKEGPELSSVGEHFHTPWIEESIRDPRANMPMSIMPLFDLPEEDLQDLLVYLTSLRGLSMFEDPVSRRTKDREWKAEQPPELLVTAQQGKESLEGSACLACHKLGEEDGGFSPTLDFQGLLRDPEWVADHIGEPREHVPGSSMPAFWMSASEREAIADYLVAFDAVERSLDPARQYEQLCARCHGDEGDGHGMIADNLLPVPREFDNDKFFDWLPESRAHEAILNGVPGTAMPSFVEVLAEATAPAEPAPAEDEDRASPDPAPEDPAERQARAEQAAEDLFAWIRAEFIGGDRPERKSSRKIPEANSVAFGEASVGRGQTQYRARCYGCHGLAADGKGPNAVDLVPRPRDLTNTPFMAEIDDLRLYESITYGIVGTGMPPWDYLTENVRWDLVNYIRAVSETDPISHPEGALHD